MNKGDNVVLAKSESGDWCGLYINDVLVRQAHDFPPTQILLMLGISVRNIIVSGEIMDSIGKFPETFNELDKYIDDEMNCKLF